MSWTASLDAMSAHKPGVLHRPSGPVWDARARHLRAGWFRQGRACYYCGHGFEAEHLIEVAHIISWMIRWDLREDPANLVPSHGGGAARCPVCTIACNQAAHNAPDAPRNPATGASLPFTEKFMARQIELRRRFLARSGKVAPAGRAPAKPAVADPGREW